MQPCPKPEPKSKERAREKRHEAAVIKAVRAHVSARDGYCRARMVGTCDGRDEWAHLEDKRRARTVGMAPEERHTANDSLMLCTRHHDDYDEGRLAIFKHSPMGAEGHLAFYSYRLRRFYTETSSGVVQMTLSEIRAVAALILHGALENEL